MRLEAEDKFLPHRVNIDGFGAGGFRFGGYSHLGSLLIVPSGMRAWAPRAIADVTMADLAMLQAEKSEIDFLLIGTGAAILPLPKLLRDGLSGMNFDQMSTSAAISTYNVILAEGRRVAACLISVEQANAR
jgi:uncharacterized protein